MQAQRAERSINAAEISKQPLIVNADPDAVMWNTLLYVVVLWALVAVIRFGM